MLDKIKTYKAVISFVVLAVVAIAYNSLTTIDPIYAVKETVPQETEEMEELDEVEVVEEEIAYIAEEIPIYICGEIASPGVYYMKEGDLVNDLVVAAQGLTVDADATAINLAAPLETNQKIIIPKIGEAIVIDEEDIVTNIENTTTDDGRININTATTSQLKTLSGIGDVKALAIVDYRSDNGGFSSIEELRNVTGIGDKTFEAIQNNVKIE